MMTWTKIDQTTGEPAKRNCNSFEPHDYLCREHGMRIINNSFTERKNSWVLIATNGYEFGRYNTLKAAKARAEEVLAAVSELQ